MSGSQKVLVTLTHPGSAIEYLKGNFEVSSDANTEPLSAAALRGKLSDRDGVMSILEDRFDESLIQACPRLKVIANVAVGFDNVDVDSATKHGVVVCNTPGVLDNTTADMAFGLLLAAARRIVEADSYIRTGQWEKFRFDLLLGHNVHGKTLGIIGLGRIGQCMARRARGFDMKILYSNRKRLPQNKELELGVQYAELEALLQESDFVSIHCPLNSETHHLIGDRQLSLMKPGSILINTARGAIIDEQALVRALKNGPLSAAGLDVFEKEPHPLPQLLSMPNVVLAPHIGSASLETRENMATLAAEGLVAALSGRMPPNIVNPQVWPEFIKRLNQQSGCPS